MKEINIKLMGEAAIIAIGLWFAADVLGAHLERGLAKINIQVITEDVHGTGN